MITVSIGEDPRDNSTAPGVLVNSYNRGDPMKTTSDFSGTAVGRREGAIVGDVVGDDVIVGLLLGLAVGVNVGE
jgi:hypothetical protein